jgi:hypothetical protein
MVMTFSFVVVCSDGARRHGSHETHREALHAMSWSSCPFGHRIVREVAFDSPLLRREHPRVRA